MFNAIRMEIYRMFQSKSFYIALISLIFTIFFSTNMSAQEWNHTTLEERQALHELFLNHAETDQIAIAVSIPTEPDSHVTVYDLFFANVKSKLIALVFACFTVIYSTADITSGYIKNIAGQLKNRRFLIYAKALSLLIYCTGSMVLLVGIHAICNQLFFGYIEWGPWNAFLPYIGIQILLHYAFILFIMMLATVLKNNILTTALSIGFCINIQIIFYGFIDKLVNKIGMTTYHTREYTVLGNISRIGMQITQKTAIQAILVTLVFLIFSVWIASTVFNKRDI